MLQQLINAIGAAMLADAAARASAEVERRFPYPDERPIQLARRIERLRHDFAHLCLEIDRANGDA